MNQLTKFVAFLLIVFAFITCKKDKEVQSPLNPPVKNLPPIARAGADSFFTVSSCSERITADLEGSNSTDPEGKPISYTWRKISGTPGSVFIINGAKARVENISPGEHAFELLVRDNGNLEGRDTVLISVKSLQKEYDLDITFNSTFSFIDNAKECSYYYGCSYFDGTVIDGIGPFLPFGEFNLNISESTDTAASEYATSSYIRVYRGNMNNASLIGTSSVNWKKLIQQGGGSFSGSFTVTDGSAKKCDGSIYNNLLPLSITGSLDIITNKVTVRIKGKVYF